MLLNQTWLTLYTTMVLVVNTIQNYHNSFDSDLALPATLWHDDELTEEGMFKLFYVTGAQP